MAAHPIVRPPLKKTVPLGLGVEKPQGILLQVIEDHLVSDFARAERQRLAACPDGRPNSKRSGLGIRTPKVVLRGRAAEQISQAAREHEADLIVIGLHGGEPMAVYLGGTVAYRLVRQAPCPVLTVPAAIHE